MGAESGGPEPLGNTEPITGDELHDSIGFGRRRRKFYATADLLGVGLGVELAYRGGGNRDTAVVVLTTFTSPDHFYFAAAKRPARKSGVKTALRPPSGPPRCRANYGALDTKLTRMECIYNWSSTYKLYAWNEFCKSSRKC